MNPYTRGALFIIRLVAFGLILLSVLWLGAHLFLVLGHKKTGGALWIVLKSLPFVAGVALLIKSHAVAKKLTEDFDE